MLSLLKLLRLQYLNVNIRNYKYVSLYLLPCEGGEASSSSGKAATVVEDEDPDAQIGDTLLFLAMHSRWGDQGLPVCSLEEQVITPADDDGEEVEADEDPAMMDPAMRIQADDGGGGEQIMEANYGWMPPHPPDPNVAEDGPCQMF